MSNDQAVKASYHLDHPLRHAHPLLLSSDSAELLAMKDLRGMGRRETLISSIADSQPHFPEFPFALQLKLSHGAEAIRTAKG